MSIGWMAGLRRSLGVCLVAGVAVLGFAGANAQAKVAANCVPPINLEAPEQNLSYCNLNGANISVASALERSNLTGAKLKGATISGEFALTQSNLTRASLRGATISGYLTLAEATAIGAVLSEATIPGGKALEGADLAGAKLNRTIAGGEYDLAESSNLTGASLIEAQLTGIYAGLRSNFTGANLARAIISGQNALVDADLTGANLKGAQVTGIGALEGATYSSTKCPDGTNSDNDGGTCVGHGVP